MLFLHASASVYWLCCLFEVIVNCCNGSFPLFFLIIIISLLFFGVFSFRAWLFSISISNVGWVRSLNRCFSFGFLLSDCVLSATLRTVQLLVPSFKRVADGRF